MFASGPSYGKLKTNLRLCINRLKLLEKKKTEMALKSRKEIADYIALGKVERAKIRVEHIIREDYLVEALELLEMLCDLLLARFGLIEQMKTLDDGLAEAISSIIWVAPRLQADVQELKVVSDQLTAKYGKPYGMACRENSVGTVSEKLMHKLSVQAPPKVTVEKYLIEIAKYYNVDYEPDSQVMAGEGEGFAADALIDLAPAPPLPEKNDLNTNNFGGGGAAAAMPRQQPYVPFNYPASSGAPYNPYTAVAAASGGAMPYPNAGGPVGTVPPTGRVSAGGFNIPAQKSVPDIDDAPPAYFPPDVGSGGQQQQPPLAPGVTPLPSQQQQQEPKIVRSVSDEDNTTKSAGGADFPELPGVPDDAPVEDDFKKGQEEDEEEIDFDDLTRRFEALKKKK